MAKPIPTRFCVSSDNKDAAVAHLRARGFVPVAIETDKVGFVALIFEPLPDDQLLELFRALPLHLSAKTGVVMGAGPPVMPKTYEM